jgi:alkanesulfonate monooxygenase SsuD/methylene tetrahydromethanopterin reductase-like flavin-dependent oxidoreductase (luciferase family)
VELGFFTMPVHPMGRPWLDTLREDREAFCLAEALGFTEAYVGEHVSDAVETITSSIVFLASLADRITRMRLGTGTVNLPNLHPAQVASQIAMLDHLLEGRLNFGISPGGLLSDAELFGNLDADRNAMFVEAIDTILKIWQGEPPYDIAGRFWKISTSRTMMPEIGQGFLAKPLQRPHPPIVVTAVAPFSKGVAAAAARGWDPISANFLLPRWVATHRDSYAEGCVKGGRPVDLARWRVAKSIFVADDSRTAEEYARGPGSPYVFYYRQLFTKLVKNGRANLFKEDQNAPDESVRLEDVLDTLIIHGTPDKVTEDLIAFRETVGPFGTLLYAGHDWRDETLARRSMQLLAETVAPKVTEATEVKAAQ